MAGYLPRLVMVKEPSLVHPVVADPVHQPASPIHLIVADLDHHLDHHDGAARPIADLVIPALSTILIERSQWL
ncbi:hypothetical protein M378DRAFT_159334 [Amanita muscaria Koide BX008]|uniref:Uncharacterized protein n=1 Tax=Amanita muscaria (strain Koide BX008) TaxID=946122 RepID=A0A0C2SVT0_AMAMK|nr:hypothetical protein M378DRAFT_159334 [Amanita muscaria Koide BX008]